MIDVKPASKNSETLRRIELLEDALQTKVVGSGLTAAAKPIKAMMKQLAPEQTGALKKAIGQSRLSGRAASRLNLFGESVRLMPGQVAILIGPNRKVGKRRLAGLGSIQEFGSKRHFIRPKKRGGVLKIGRNSFARFVRHPGTKATNFMKKSLDANASEIDDLFMRGMTKRLDRI